MACLRLFTRPPLPALPELSVPRFLLRIALATVLLAPLRTCAVNQIVWLPCETSCKLDCARGEKFAAGMRRIRGGGAWALALALALDERQCAALLPSGQGSEFRMSSLANRLHQVKSEESEPRPMKKVGFTVSGWIIIGLGIAGLALPIVPGVVLIVLGLVILSSHYVWAQGALAWLRRKFPKTLQFADLQLTSLRQWFTTR